MQKHVSRCRQCVLSAAIPRITFDQDGVCNFCRNQSHYSVDADFLKNSADKINRMIDEKRGLGDYDAIVCYSGGKDSTYTLMLAKQKYDLRVLAFTLDNGFLSPTAFDNINHVVDDLGVDSVIVRPSSAFMSSLVRASALEEIYNPKSLVRISAVCNSCISLVNITALRLAILHHIPFIIAGFTFGQIPAKTIMYQNNYQFLKESRQKSIEKLRAYTGDSIDDYFLLSDTVLSQVDSFPYNLNLLCLEDITEHHIYQAVESIGWKAPKDVDGCSSNCRLNTFNNYIHAKRFGYNPYEWELSHLIRNKQLSREEALEKIDQQPLEEISSICEKLAISEAQFKDTFEDKR